MYNIKNLIFLMKYFEAETSNIFLCTTIVFKIYSAIKTDIAVAISTPAIPKKFTKTKDKIKLTIVSVSAQSLVSLYSPPADTNKVVSILTIKVNNIDENDSANKKLVAIFPSYQISIKSFIARVNGTHTIIAIKKSSPKGSFSLCLFR